VRIAASIQVISNHKKRDVSISGRHFFNQSKSELQKIEQTLSNDNYSSYSDLLQYIEDEEYEPINMEQAERLTKSMTIAFTFNYYRVDKNTWEKARELDTLKRAERLYAIFFNKFHFIIGHYFRHIYHMLSFLEKIEIEKKE